MSTSVIINLLFNSPDIVTNNLLNFDDLYSYLILFSILEQLT